MAVVINGTTGIDTIQDDAVGLAQMASGTDGNLITYDASGNPAAVAVGTSEQVLTSNGAGAAPTFQAAAGGNSPAFCASISSDQSITVNVDTKVTFNTEEFDTDSAYDTTNYRFTVPSGKAGKYLFIAQVRQSAASGDASYFNTWISKNGTNVLQSNFHLNSTNLKGGSVTASWMEDCIVGDYFEAYVSFNGTTLTATSLGSSFMGMKIG